MSDAISTFQANLMQGVKRATKRGLDSVALTWENKGYTGGSIVDDTTRLMSQEINCGKGAKLTVNTNGDYLINIIQFDENGDYQKMDNPWNTVNPHSYTTSWPRIRVLVKRVDEGKIDVSEGAAIYLYMDDSQDLTWSRLVEIKDFPDLEAAPEPLDKTTTADPQRTYIEGILNNEQKTFTCNYNATDYAAIEALKGQEIDVGMWFGATKSGSAYTPDGSYGKFAGKGYVSVHVNGGGINEVVNMTVTLTMTQGFEPTFIS